MIRQPRHPFLSTALEELADTFCPDFWGSAGPALMRRFVAKFMQDFAKKKWDLKVKKVGRILGTLHLRKAAPKL